MIYHHLNNFVRFVSITIKGCLSSLFYFIYMKPIEFEQQTVILAKDQPEYQPLPVHIGSSSEGEIISCWELSDEDIAQLTKTRKLWLSQLTFGQMFQPQLPCAYNPFESQE